MTDKYSFFSCPAIVDDVFGWDVDINLRSSGGSRTSVQRISGRVRLEDMTAASKMNSLAVERRFPARILGQPFSIITTGGQYNYTSFGSHEATIDFETVVDSDSGPFEDKTPDAVDVDELIACFQQVMGKLDFTTGRVRFDAILGACIDPWDLQRANAILNKVDPTGDRERAALRRRR